MTDRGSHLRGAGPDNAVRRDAESAETDRPVRGRRLDPLRYKHIAIAWRLHQPTVEGRRPPARSTERGSPDSTSHRGRHRVPTRRWRPWGYPIEDLDRGI